MTGLNNNNKKPIDPTAKFYGTTAAALIELVFLHPADTAAKRFMGNAQPIQGTTWSVTRQNMARVVFQETYGQSLFSKLRSLYSGFMKGVMYKPPQRLYRFGAQSMTQDVFHGYFGMSPTASAALSGAIIGVGEVPALLPLHILKVRAQVLGRDAPRLSLVQMFARYPLKTCYKSGMVTAQRNLLGSVGLFAGRQYTQDLYQRAGMSLEYAKTLGAFSGAFISLVVSNPADVVATRMLKVPLEQPITARETFVHIVKTEGVKGLGKGLGAKLPIQTAKLGLGLRLAQACIEYFEDIRQVPIEKNHPRTPPTV